MGIAEVTGEKRTNDLFDCENGSWDYEGKPVKDFHPYGVLDVTGILRKSSNIGAAKIAVKLVLSLVIFTVALLGYRRQKKITGTSAERTLLPFVHTAGALALVTIVIAVVWPGRVPS